MTGPWPMGLRLRRLILRDDLGRDPASERHSDALAGGPLPHNRGAGAGTWDRTLLVATGGDGAAELRAPAVLDELGQRLPQRPGVLLAQVDLVAASVQTECDGLRGLTAVQVVHHRHGCLLRHSVPPHSRRVNVSLWMPVAYFCGDTRGNDHRWVPAGPSWCSAIGQKRPLVWLFSFSHHPKSSCP